MTSVVTAYNQASNFYLHVELLDVSDQVAGYLDTISSVDIPYGKFSITRTYPVAGTRVRLNMILMYSGNVSGGPGALP